MSLAFYTSCFMLLCITMSLPTSHTNIFLFQRFIIFWRNKCRQSSAYSKWTYNKIYFKSRAHLKKNYDAKHNMCMYNSIMHFVHVAFGKWNTIFVEFETQAQPKNENHRYVSSNCLQCSCVHKIKKNWQQAYSFLSTHEYLQKCLYIACTYRQTAR